jgi:ABC-type branched-subunit amino acid transport system substrate-binding protein
VAREDNTSVLAEAVERSRPDVVLTVADEFACVGLARALTEMSYQPRAVVSSSTCTARHVHDKLGDWPPEWFYIAGGPDLETYDSNPHAQLYRDRVRRYGGEDADWTYRAALAFAAVMNASRILTHGEEAGDFNGYTGPIFMGVESYHCGKLPDWPGFCQHQARIMRYLSQRGWENVTENGPLTLP